MVASIPRTAAELNLSGPTVASAFEHMQRLGIVKEVTGRARDRLYMYSEYLRILSEGTDPLPAGEPAAPAESIR